MVPIWQITPTQTIELDIPANSLDDATRNLPEGYYSTFRTFDGGRRVLGLNSHLERLYGPVSAPAVDESLLRRHLFALLEPYRPGEARVRAVMTKQGQAFLAIEPLKPLPPEVYERGVTVQTAELPREHPRLKSTAFIERSDSERKHIAEEGIFEALLVNDGYILEGMTSNFFYVIYPRAELKEWRRGAVNTDETGASSASREAGLPGDMSPGALREREVTLGTARDDVLLGITREAVIEVARGRGLKVEYEPLNLDQISRVQESFITSSSRGVVPVVRIDRVTIGQGSPGPVTKELASAYEAYVVEKAEPIL